MMHVRNKRNIDVPVDEYENGNYTVNLVSKHITKLTDNKSASCECEVACRCRLSRMQLQPNSYVASHSFRLIACHI